MATSEAYAAGLRDGADWDLDGFDSVEQAAAQSGGWDTATINAMGSTHCARAWGVPEEGSAWERACEEYNQGVRDSLAERAREAQTDTSTYAYVAGGERRWQSDDHAEACDFARRQAANIANAWPSDATVDDLDGHLEAVDAWYSDALLALVRRELGKLRHDR